MFIKLGAKIEPSKIKIYVGIYVILPITGCPEICGGISDCSEKYEERKKKVGYISIP